MTQTLCFYAQFTASKVGVNSLTVTWDIERITRSDGTRSALITGGANSITVGRRGLYGYVLTGADLSLYDYLATAITSDASVDAKEVPGLWTRWDELAAVAGDAMALTSGERSTLYSGIWSNATRTLTSISALASEIAAAVLDVLASLHNLPNTIGAAINSAGGGSITVNAYVAVSSTTARAVSTGNLAIQTHYTLAQSITSTLTDDLSSATKLWLAIKRSAKDTDSASIVLIEKTAGLTVLAGASYTPITDGALTVSGSSGAWQIDIDMQEAATALLDSYTGFSYPAELKALVAGDTICIWTGNANITAGIVQAVS